MHKNYFAPYPKVLLCPLKGQKSCPTKHFSIPKFQYSDCSTFLGCLHILQTILIDFIFGLVFPRQIRDFPFFLWKKRRRKFKIQLAQRSTINNLIPIIAFLSVCITMFFLHLKSRVPPQWCKFVQSIMISCHCCSNK